MIDDHAHIHDPQFDADREAVLRRALGARVSKIITVGTSVVESLAAVEAAKKYENVFATVAIHPHELSGEGGMKNKELGEGIRNLKTIVLENRDKVVAVGECGLDFFGGGKGVSDEEKNMQTEGFLAQIKLAREFDLPVVIHCRDAYEEVFNILQPTSNCQSPHSCFILHCYMGDREMTEKFLIVPSVYFSFAGNITYPVKKLLMGTKDDIHESLKCIPLSRMLTETDCPYLAPQKYRGTRNEPAYVIEVARKIAEVKQVPFEEVDRATEETAYRCFPRLRENTETI